MQPPLPLVVACATAFREVLAASLRTTIAMEGTVVLFVARNEAEGMPVGKEDVQDDILKHRKRSA